MKKRTHHKPSGLSYFQHALLYPILQPENKPAMNPAAAIKVAQKTYRAAGWTAGQARAELRHKGSK